MSEAAVLCPDALILQLSQEGHTDSAIAERIGRKARWVKSRREKLGIQKPHRSKIRSRNRIWSPALDERLVELYEAGESTAAIAEKLGVSTTSVRSRSQSLGLARPETPRGPIMTPPFERCPLGTITPRFRHYRAALKALGYRRTQGGRRHEARLLAATIAILGQCART